MKFNAELTLAGGTALNKMYTIVCSSYIISKFVASVPHKNVDVSDEVHSRYKYYAYEYRDRTLEKRYSSRPDFFHYDVPISF